MESQFVFDKEVTLTSGSVKWQTPSNIALVKYWGKTDPQIPKNTSISFTLSNCHTQTQIDYSIEKVDYGNSQNFQVIFEGERNKAFEPKIQQFLDRIYDYVPFIKEVSLTITSTNSFPHSSGIASSASGLSAIAMGIMSIEKELNPEMTEEYFYQKASFLARLGSGSACRSVKGNLVVWGEHSNIKESSNLYGVEFDSEVAPIFQNYQDTILLVDKGEKQVSSTVGHGLMNNHPFAEKRFDQAQENIDIIKKQLIEGDIDGFINTVESEALTLHAMMMTSNPYFILMKPNTLEIINKIWYFRQETGSKCCFTLDAGANVHLLYPEVEKESVQKFIETELKSFCKNGEFIHDKVGNGAIQL